MNINNSILLDIYQTQKMDGNLKNNKLNTNPNEVDKDLMKACKDFESIFLKQMLDSMRKTVNKSGLIPESMSENVFEDMLYGEYSKKMANTSSIGLSQILYKQLSHTAQKSPI